MIMVPMQVLAKKCASSPTVQTIQMTYAILLLILLILVQLAANVTFVVQLTPVHSVRVPLHLRVHLYLIASPTAAASFK